MSHSFLAGAEAEYLEAIQFFEEQRSGLGTALIAEFERIVALAVERPDAWKLVHPSGIRRIGLAQFPYAVYYRVLPNESVEKRDAPKGRIEQWHFSRNIARDSSLMSRSMLLSLHRGSCRERWSSFGNTVGQILQPQRTGSGHGLRPPSPPPRLLAQAHEALESALGI